MKISGINQRVRRAQVNFGRALTSEEMREYDKILTEAKQKVGNDGKSILIVHDACLPQSSSSNTGVGNISSKKSSEFFDFMKNYLHINAVEVLPQGELRPLRDGHFFCAYASSSLSLSPHQINPELLLTPKYASLITPDEFDSLIKSNTHPNKETLVNYENIVTKDSPFETLLRKAFGRFQSLDYNDKLRIKFQGYKASNNVWLEPKILYQALTREYKHSNWHKWNELDKNLIGNKSEEAKARIKQLKSDYGEEAEFYRFKQFLADMHLKEGREMLNKKGLKLIGDCLVGYTPDEVWANQKAFNLDYSLGWGVPAYNYDEIQIPNSPAYNLLRRKVRLFAQRYDSIRFDVSWSYVEPHLNPYKHMNGTPYGKSTKQGTKLLETIEGFVKEIKGEVFSTKDLIHEFDADASHFSMLGDDGKWRPEIMNRTKALGTTYMQPNWGSNVHFLHLNNGEPNFILGVGNHDPQPLRQIAYGVPDINGEVYKPKQIQHLSWLFNENSATLENPIEFIKAKFAEITTAKNNQYFYMDIFGREDRFDSHSKNTSLNYRQKIPENYEKQYFEALESGHGFNPMDALERVFRLKQFDTKEPDLYKRIVKFRDILTEKAKESVESIRTTSVNIIQNSASKPHKLTFAVVTAIGLGVTAATAYLKYNRNNENGAKITLSAPQK